MINKTKPIIILLLIAILATTLFTWPFITKLQSYYTDAGDYPLSGWLLWYNYQSIISGRILDQALYFQTYQFYPLPYSLAYSEHLFVHSLVFFPIYFLSKNLILSVNIYVFLAYILSFIPMYYVAYFFTKNFFASIIATIIYTFNPLTYAHINQGHIFLMGKYFLPLVILFAYRYFQRPTYLRSFLFFLAFTLNALTSVLFLFITTTILIFYIPICISFNIFKKTKQYILQLTKTSLLLFIFLPVFLYFNLPYLAFSQKEGAVRTLHESQFYAALPMDWLLSTPDSLLYGKLAESLEPTRSPKDAVGSRLNFNYGEHTLFLNIMPLILFIFGILGFIKKYKNGTMSVKNNYIFIGFFTILILAYALSTQAGSSAAYYAIPFLHGMRTPSRFEFILYVPFTIFAAFGFLSFKKYKKAYTGLAFLAITILFIENYHINNYTQTSSQLKDYTGLSKELTFLTKSTTFHIPYRISDSGGNYLNWDTITQERMLNGHSGYYPPDWVQLVLEINRSLDEKSMTKLAALDINYVIIHKNLLSKDQASFYKNNDFFNVAKVYEDEKLLILNIKKYKYKINICNIDKDFSIKSINNLQLVLTNTKNCYLPSKFDKRYTTLTLKEGNKKHTISVKLPLLISPYEKVELHSP